MCFQVLTKVRLNCLFKNDFLRIVPDVGGAAMASTAAATAATPSRFPLFFSEFKNQKTHSRFSASDDAAGISVNLFLFIK